MSKTDQPSDPGQAVLVKTSIDKDLGKFVQLEQAIQAGVNRTVGIGLAVLFLAMTGLLVGTYSGWDKGSLLIIISAMLGGYMALNIGANDVANNVGPAVGSKALTMLGALIIAAIFESAGALIAGGEVISTIKKGIIDPGYINDSSVFIQAMLAALISAALWVNIATWISAPVSTTHSLVGGVMGAGIAAAGFQAVNWVTMGKIAASWVISPVLGGIIAAIFLAIIKINIIYKQDKIAAARRWVPILVAVMSSAFTTYLVLKGLKKVWKPDTITIVLLATAVLAVSWTLLKPWVNRKAAGLENRNQSLRVLFQLPLIFSAALLSFAHGANDVANAIGPLAGILQAIETGAIGGKAGIPLWVMLIGAAGISLGLFLFGPRLIRMVGKQITKMNPMRAFCVALSAAITVIIASGLGLPVSSTHIAVGAVFGVGFFREYYTGHSKRRREYVARRHPNPQPSGARTSDPKKVKRRKLVRRAHVNTILAAWLITVPASALLAGALFWLISAVF